MPRKPKAINPEAQRIILETLRGGGYAVTACNRAGIAESVYYYWLDQGEAGKQPYLEFLEATKRASADAETQAVATVLKVAFDPEDPNWQAAMTYLERRHPERWGRRVVENRVTGGDGKGPVQVATISLNDLVNDDAGREALLGFAARVCPANGDAAVPGNDAD